MNVGPEPIPEAGEQDGKSLEQGFVVNNSSLCHTFGCRSVFFPAPADAGTAQVDKLLDCGAPGGCDLVICQEPGMSLIHPG